jgi:hypothetical protein
MDPKEKAKELYKKIKNRQTPGVSIHKPRAIKIGSIVFII